jgi:hypothetical protein
MEKRGYRMACNCGERYQRVFDSENLFKVYFDAERQYAPIEWKEEGIRVCIGCGDMTSRVPDSALLELRRGAGGDESAV